MCYRGTLLHRRNPLKTVVLLLLVAIVISLGFALFSLAKKDSDPNAMLNALKIRVALSVLLIVVLVVSWNLGMLNS